MDVRLDLGKLEIFTFEDARSVCRMVAIQLDSLQRKATNKKDVALLKIRARLYRRDAQRNAFGNEVSYLRAKRYHQYFLKELSSDPSGTIIAAARPFTYDRSTEAQSLQL